MDESSPIVFSADLPAETADRTDINRSPWQGRELEDGAQVELKVGSSPSASIKQICDGLGSNLI